MNVNSFCPLTLILQRRNRQSKLGLQRSEGIESPHPSLYSSQTSYWKVLLHTKISADPSVTLGLMEKNGVRHCYFNWAVLCHREREPIFFLVLIYLPEKDLLNVSEWSQDIKQALK